MLGKSSLLLSPSSVKIRFVPASHLKTSSSSKRHEKTILKKKSFHIQRNVPLTIGRDSSVCTFPLDSTSYPKILSKCHAKIYLINDGKNGNRIFLMDNGSTNGTLVNGTKVDQRKPMPLPSGSLIVFGGKKSDIIYEMFIDIY